MPNRGRLRTPDQLSAALRREFVRHVAYADVLSEDIERTWAEIAALTAEATAGASEPSASPEARKAATRRRRALAQARRRLLALLRAHGYQSERVSDLAVKLWRWRNADADVRASPPRLTVVA